MTEPRKSRHIAFLHEPVPDHGRATPEAEGVRRIVAANPGPMTYHGTNTFLVEGAGGSIVVDPGPDLPDHVAAILRATGGRVSAIVVGHGHGDHAGAADRLRVATGAPVCAAPLPPVAERVTIDRPLAEGDRIGDLEVLATPGHSRDHLCLVRAADGLLFSGDHVMTWSSSVVPPQHGHMGDYMRSLDRLVARDDAVLLPGHGPRMPRPRAFCRALLHLRQRREAQVLRALSEGPAGLPDLVRRLYPHQTDDRTIRAAGFTLLAHLRKLAEEGRAREVAPDSWALDAGA